MNEHIKRAIACFDSAAKFGAAVERSPSFVSQLALGQRPVPAELCPVIERATSGAVRCEDLRPDVQWEVLRLQAAPAAQA